MSGQEPPVRHELVDPRGMLPVGRRTTLRSYLVQLWRRRHFIITDAKSKVISGTRESVLGTAWLVLSPMLDAAAYGFIFGVILGTSEGRPYFIPYLLVGVFLFRFTTQCMNTGANAITGNKSIIRALSFPRAALPIAIVARELYRFLPALGTMLILIIVIPPHANISWRWLIFPVILLLQAMFSLGLAFIFARLVASYNDVRHLLPVITRLWFYGSAVFFTIDRFDKVPVLLTIMQHNPMFVILDMSRDVLVFAENPSLYSWGVLIGFTLVSLFGGLYYFWRGEDQYGN